MGGDTLTHTQPFNSLLNSILRLDTPTPSHLELGKRGELVALRWLVQRGYTCIDRNYSCKFGEIDLIVQDLDGTVVFVEVKTRSTTNFGAAEAITANKVRKMRATAGQWLRQKATENWHDVRFDAIVVQFGPQQDTQVDHYRGI